MNPRVHFVWWQGGRLDDPFRSWVGSWEQLWHQEPTEIHVWTGREIRELAKRHGCLDWIDRACGRSQATNLGRHLLLREYGGLYLDTDYQRIGDVAEHLADTPAGELVGVWCTADRSRASNAFLYTPAAGHPIPEACVQDIDTADPGVQLSAGIEYTTRHLRHYEALTRMLPWHIASPRVRHYGQLGHQALVHPETVAIHWWASRMVLGQTHAPAER